MAKKYLSSKRSTAQLSRTELYSHCGSVTARSLPNTAARWNFYVGGIRRAIVSIDTRDKALVTDIAEALAASVKRGAW